MKNLTKTNSIWPSAAALAAAVVSIIAPALSVHGAITNDTLLITQNSATSLAVTWNGNAITPTFLSADNWDITLPIAIHLGFGGGSFGLGPVGPAVTPLGGGDPPWNNVFTSTTIGTPDTTLVTVQADDPTTSGYAFSLANDTLGLSGSDANGLPVYVLYDELGNGNGGGGGSVPDHASTGLLALISVIVLFGMAKFQAAPARNS